MSEQGLIEAPKAQTNEMQDTSNPARRAADKAVEQVVEKPELNLGSAEDFKSFAAQGNGNGSKTEEEIRNAAAAEPIAPSYPRPDSGLERNAEQAQAALDVQQSEAMQDLAAHEAGNPNIAK
ncbi:hypothetical protein KC946_02495 [Candidatus Saccharibacteria bacterium]|nr:hypothetical protein [Candidatus Saccharibacteria bacterium]